MNVINQVLYLLWQSGTLRRVGQSSELLDALPSEVRDLAFDVSGFNPGLPPTVVPGLRGGDLHQLPLVLGDVALGTWGERRVVGHGVAPVGVTQIGDELELSATPTTVTANCTETYRGRARLTPCLSDLLPVIREKLAEKPRVYRLAGGEILGRLPRLTFQGLELRLSKLRVSTTAAPAQMEVQVDAAITAGSR